VTRDPSLDVLKQSAKLLDAMDAAISSEAAKWSKLLYGTVVYRVNYTDETVEVVPYPEWPEQMRGSRCDKSYRWRCERTGREGDGFEFNLRKAKACRSCRRSARRSGRAAAQ